MALPKRKISKSRGAKRRTHQKVTLANPSVCPQCNEPKLPHHVCPNCGQYKGRTVIETEEV
ncbi:MAG: 50S ribosomal protein L32 [Deltaproteobacteria bacterium]|nr:50S ribosomal protein L32 [Deltaproteobacteria bacterium]MBW2018871.1 50S ribosomal protein L32 [Deltaproteobacteria bacterium]MBW2073626.1 50S ribosomal protein L32 [Deltaproteobacteria bacterium]RLB81936.1 MAG: 50S ribosomal protein L32 [Deltaproteobacteria bacterium]